MATEKRGEDSFADRAVETLRRYEAERESNPAWRASSSDRGYARVIDGILLGAVAVVVLGVLANQGMFAESEQLDFTGQQTETPPTVNWGPVAPTWNGIIGIGAIFALVASYEVLFTRFLGGTLGKHLLGLRVVSYPSRKEPDLARVMTRTGLWLTPVLLAVIMWFTSVLLAWTALLAAFWIYRGAFSPESDGRTRYDRFAGTVVARKKTGNE